ncbi:MFS transporter [Amycolatopsis rhabdoformis]|uniref:MFS transporter n=1 Tax=Amycolatopsis rhabdoformis TaxID=1448059 RepID=A0ABZ1I926_9PSEU|nr:MFS transporter [Amycolatopsis rhabdoformis]WSE30423.1 MFS transporter [Amycolatopsis rhabdoformis]
MTRSQLPPGVARARGAAEIAARVDRVPTGRFHLRLASIVGVGTFFDGFDAISLAVILPVVVKTFGIDLGQAGLIISAGYLGQFAGAIAVGLLSDRIGRRRAFLLSLAIMSVLAVFCAFAWSSRSLLVFRLLQGIGLGAEVPIAGTIVNEFLGRRNRGRIGVGYQSLFSWGLFFAPLVALLLTSSLGPATGWRVLLGLGALPLIVVAVGLVALPESPRWLAQRGRLAEADAVVTAMEAGRNLPAPDPAPVVDDRPFDPREVLRGQYGRRTLLLVVLWFLAFFVTYGYSSWLPTIYVSVGKLSATYSLTLTVVLGAIQVLMCYVVAWCVEHLGRKRSLVYGFGLSLLGGLFGFVNLVLLHNTTWPYLFTTGIVIGVGIIFPATSLYVYTGELYPTRMRGFATSLTSSFARLASIVSPLVFGFLLSAPGGAGLVFAVLGGAALIGALTMAFAGIETRARSLEELSG